MSHLIRTLLLTLAIDVLLHAAPALAATSVPLEADEADLNQRRKEWIERIHRHAPNVDWREIESANRLEAQFLRQSMQGTFGASPWRERGASNLTGRNWVSAVASDGVTVYIGSEKGGLFGRVFSDSGDWTPLTDDVGYGVHHLAIVPGTPEKRFIGSNDGRMFYSADDGATWNVPSGLPEDIWYTARVVQEADDPETIYALTDAWIWTGSEWDHNYHLLRSQDGGATFTRVHTEPLDTRPDIWISRTGAGPLYLAVNGELKSSSDHGETFATVGTLPTTGYAARLAGSEAGAPHFYYALRTDNGWELYGSADGGANWSFLTSITDFYETLFATMTDEDQVFYGGVNCHRSLDGGASFDILNDWTEYYADPDTKLHADIFGLTSHVLPIAKNGPVGEVIFIHTDGGTYTLLPSAAVPSNLTKIGFRNAQYYGTLTSFTDPDVIFAGSQDQGYQISHPGLSTVTPEFTQVISGDYAHLTSSWPDRSRMVYCVYPAFVLVQTGPGDMADLEGSDFPVDAPGFTFLPAITADPDDPSIAYVGARQLWQLERNDANVYTWTALSYDFDAGDGDIVGALAIAPTDTDRWYVATYNGRLYWSEDRGANWTLSSITGPPSHFFSGSDVIVSPTDPLVAYVGGSGYSNPGVFKTIDGGSELDRDGGGIALDAGLRARLRQPSTPGTVRRDRSRTLPLRPIYGRVGLATHDHVLRSAQRLLGCRIRTGPKLDALQHARPWDLGLPLRADRHARGRRSVARASLDHTEPGAWAGNPPVRVAIGWTSASRRVRREGPPGQDLDPRRTHRGFASHRLTSARRERPAAGRRPVPRTARHAAGDDGTPLHSAELMRTISAGDCSLSLELA